LVVTGETSRVEMLTDPKHPPDAPPGSTYLVPPGKSREIQKYLQRQEAWAGKDGGWTLRVDERSPTLQRIELVWLADGFSGSVYDAEATRITPLYRKLTGPGFAMVFGPLAFGLNTLVWVAAWLLWRWLRARGGSHAV
jgi:hypothetical protein